MPVYVYKCETCGWSCEERYARPPVEPGKAVQCRGCGATAGRDYVNEGVYVNGASSAKSITGIAGLAHRGDGVGYYVDANGQKQEVRTVKDVDRWTTSNRLGRPRLQEVKDRETGRVRHEPIRGRDGTIARESEKLIPLGGGERDFCAGRQDLNGNGTLKSHGPNPMLERFGDGWVDTSEL